MQLWLEWKQEINPLSVTDQDMNPTDVLLNNADAAPLFKGLSISTASQEPFLDDPQLSFNDKKCNKFRIEL